MTAPTDRTAGLPRSAVHAPGAPGAGEVSPAPPTGLTSPPDASGPVLRGAGPLVPAKRKRRPKDIGTAAETAVVRYLQANGWPGAERRALRGTSDAGDITGTPGVAWEVKCRNRPVSDKQVDAWMEELVTETRNARADVGILVIRRPGFGPANAGSWWAISSATDLFHIHGGTEVGPTWALVGAFWTCDIPVRLTLAHMVRLLRVGGWGDPYKGDPLEDA